MNQSTSNLPFRPCVVAVFKNDKNLFLACERSDVAGAWQFPQGGVEPGEKAEVALAREIQEELGNNQIRILRRGSNPVSYDFPPNLASGLKQKYRGQIQDWFLVEYLPGQGPQLDQADGEFQNVAWKKLDEIVNGIVVWKQDAYRRGLKELGLEV